MDKIQRIRELVHLLQEAGRTYYQEDREIMPNLEYDRLYDELAALEEETGFQLAGSPTLTVGHEVVSSLPKEKHESPMLSLDKTKDPLALKEWLGEQEGLLSFKLDGLTVVLTYRNGQLVKGITRGSGVIGEVITPNARTFVNLPLKIDFQEEVIVRGEAVIRYSDFEKINSRLPETEARYKNPRNLCSGTVRQLNSRITAERKVHFYGFSLRKAGSLDFDNSREKQMLWLKERGFEPVEYRKVRQENLEEALEIFSREAAISDLPSDGLVLTLEDIRYGQSLGTTSKFPRDSIAFKWQDEMAETLLETVEWSASRTGLINPIAVFRPVELEGTIVSRASLHNLSILRELAIGIGDILKVYKANMIIPQIGENLTRSNSLPIPEVCPVCDGKTEIRKEKDVETLLCPNPECPAKQIKGFTHFVSRDAMNMEGLSEATIEKLVGRGLVKELADLFRLSRFQEEISTMEGFGEKSCQNLLDAAEQARNTTAARLLYSLGIPGVGLANARLISRFAGGKWDRIQRLSREELLTIDGVGPVMAEQFTRYFGEEKNQTVVKDLLEEVRFEEEESSGQEFQSLAGRNIVITGSLERFENRSSLKDWIEARGGKVTDTVTAKTSLLINNEPTSGSSKNKKARELGIPILSESEFLEEVQNAENR